MQNSLMAYSLVPEALTEAELRKIVDGLLRQSSEKEYVRRSAEHNPIRFSIIYPL
jgi:hypothetical protein